LEKAAREWLKRVENGGGKWKLKRRAAPGAAAVVFALMAALGGTMFLRGGGSDRPSVASANQPAHRAASTTDAPTGDTSQVGQAADAPAGTNGPTAATRPSGAPAPSTAPGAPPAGAPAPAAPTGAAAARPRAG